MLKPLALLAMGFLFGCQSQATTPALDPDRILHMAGDEAGQIAAPKERLTRQLNIANRETQTGRPANALNTLAQARQTLEHADKNAFSDQERLSGWISLCELARNANDKAFAAAALDQALSALNQLTPDPARCEFVPGIEIEVRAVRGDAAAASLLRTAADWAMDLPQQPIRRLAYFAFAEELFSCTDYDGAIAVLRHDKDAAWRSDALTTMSDRARGIVNTRMVAMPGNIDRSAESFGPSVRGLTDAEAAPTTAPSTSFGKSLDFKSNYYRP